MFGRNNYVGYIVIENETLATNNEVMIIPYQLYIKESLINNITFSKIYSNEYSIGIDEIFNNIVTKDQFIAYRYS